MTTKESKRDTAAWSTLVSLFPEWQRDVFGVMWGSVSVTVTEDGRGWLVSGRKRPIYDVDRMVRAVEERSPLAPLDYAAYLRAKAQQKNAP